MLSFSESPLSLPVLLLSSPCAAAFLQALRCFPECEIISKNDCGSHKDRHEKLDEGMIGMEALKRIALHPVMEKLPFILETPNDDEGYISEIRTVNEWFS